jgi:hypothetical protein
MSNSALKLKYQHHHVDDLRTVETIQWRVRTSIDLKFNTNTQPYSRNGCELRPPSAHEISRYDATWRHSKQFLLQDITLLQIYFILSDRLRLCAHLIQLRWHPAGTSSVQKATMLLPLPHHGACITSVLPSVNLIRYFYSVTARTTTHLHCVTNFETVSPIHNPKPTHLNSKSK